MSSPVYMIIRLFCERDFVRKACSRFPQVFLSLQRQFPNTCFQSYSHKPLQLTSLQILDPCFFLKLFSYLMKLLFCRHLNCISPSFTGKSRLPFCFPHYKKAFSQITDELIQITHYILFFSEFFKLVTASPIYLSW